MSKNILITCSQLDGRPHFQVQNQGIMLLRKYRNKKLRIIFNVANQYQTLKQFNYKFLKLTQSSNSSPSINENTDNETYQACIQIQNHIQQLSDNRILLILNAYYTPITSSNQQIPNNYTHKYKLKYLSMLIVLGYLVASSVFYNYEGQFQQDNQFIHILSNMKQLLRETQITKLEKQIKYKSGFAKKPFLMCICRQNDQPSQLRNNFRSFFKYREGLPEIWNQAIDTLIDFFPDRSALNIIGQQIMQKLGSQFIDQILGRQIFNFEITGLSMENLCFEFCQYYNKLTIANQPEHQKKKISFDLTEIYNKIIVNQKTRVKDISMEYFISLLDQLKSKLPITETELQSLYADIQKQIISDCLEYAVNCMDLGEFKQIYTDIVSVMSAKYEQLYLLNYEKINQRNDKCFGVIEYTQQQDNQVMQNLTSETVNQVFQHITHKLQIFSEEIISETYIKKNLLIFIEGYFEKLSQSLTQKLGEYQQKQEEMHRKYGELMEDNKMMETKLRKLQQQYFMVKQISNQFKSKLLIQSEQSSNMSQQQDSSIELKNKLKVLQQQIAIKDKQIVSLHSILQKIQYNFDSKFQKPKFSKDINKLINDLNHKINDIYKLITSLKNTEQFYQNIAQQFQQKNQQIINQLKQTQLKLANQTSKVQTALKENQKLEDIINEARSAIKTMKQVQQEYKQVIDEKQTLYAKCKCLYHDAEGVLDQYKRVLQIVGDCIKTGKYAKLKDYEKITEIYQLKQLIQRILSK